nr:hypothetical protein CFP56_37292 [Quercus suber]
MITSNDMTAPHYLDYSHPSISASMDDFEAREFSPTVPDIPSQHSGFRSPQASEYSEASSGRRSYSPPAWRKAGSGWFKHQTLSPGRAGFASKESSPGEDGELTAYRIPLPDSPIKGRSPSNSPEPNGVYVEDGARTASPAVAVNVNATPEMEGLESPMEDTPTQNNYFRFSTRLDVVQRTQPIEDLAAALRNLVNRMSKSKWSTFLYAMSILGSYLLAINLLATPSITPVPDLIKVASLAKSFEPVIFYSESGHAQIGELQETGVAVWDLGESVRSTNMTSAPIIVRQLDDLSDSIKGLAHELTHFFAAVDGDIDNILLTMEWAQRELAGSLNGSPSTISSVWSNTHTLLSRIGLLGHGSMTVNLLGLTIQQQNRVMFQRIFNEFLNVLEESINNELKLSIQLFQLFESIDQQFLNLQRSVIREQDQQERMTNDFLSSLWTRVIGVNGGQLRKFERNKLLLASVRDRTIDNKLVLGEHNQRLLSLKENLEMLRRKLVSPLVRSQNATSLSIEAQIFGLQDTYQNLKVSRDSQRRKMLEVVYGAGTRRDAMRLVGS